MDLNTLVIFVMVAEAKSFSEAARRLQMPLATVSRKLAELEEQLGVRLLERSTRLVRLTAVGAEVLDQAQQSVEMGAAIDNIVSNHQSGVSGTLRLAARSSVSESLLMPLINAFQSAYPAVRVQLVITERSVDHIADGIHFDFRLGELKDSNLVARKLLTFRHRLFASSSYMNSQMPPRTPRDLLQHPLLAFSLGKPEHKSIWHFVHKSGQYTEDLSFVPFLIANDFAGLKPAILAGVGIGELPDILQASLLQDKRLIQIMPDWHFPSTSVWLVHLGGRHMSRTVRVFKEFAVRMVPELFAHFAETECCRDPAEDSTVWDQAGATVE